MVISVDFKKLIKNVTLPLIVGLLAGFLTRNDIMRFEETAVKPFFYVPGWVFPIVWTVLYILMGIAAYLIDVNATNESKKLPKTLNYLQLFFNFCWPFVFFTFNAYFFAFIWIIALWVLIIATTLQYYKISKTAAYLFIPYIIWVTFAAVLNFSIYLLN